LTLDELEAINLAFGLAHRLVAGIVQAFTRVSSFLPIG
jgi:hypothetical protein